jgi:hypothetical protein
MSLFFRLTQCSNGLAMTNHSDLDFVGVNVRIPEE